MGKPISYLQSDPKWKTKPYRVVGKETSTIGSAGCGPTSAAMVIATLADPKVTPVETCNWSMSHGFKAVNQGTFYTYFTPQLAAYGIVCNRLNTSNLYHQPNSSIHDKALASLKSGHWLICCMGPGNWTKAGHFILVYGYENGNVLINDPASRAATREKNTWNRLKNEVKYYFDITVPGNNKTTSTTSSTSTENKTTTKSEPLYWGVCTGDNVNIRAGKSSSSKSLGKAKKGEGMTCDPNGSSSTWIKVYHAGLNISGYMSAKYIKKENDTKKVETVNKKAENPIYWGICTGDDVNIRSGKGTNTMSLGKVNKGEGMTCDPNASTKDWIKVYHAGLNVVGFISADFIKKA